MRAYHNRAELKQSTLVQVQAHEVADEIVQGQYWERGRGCAVGCLAHESYGGHHLYPERWGIPECLAYLEDRIFEGLPAKTAKTWPRRFLEAIPVGADLSLVWPRFALAMLTDPEHGVLRHTAEGSAQRTSVERVAELFRAVTRGETVEAKMWREARAYAAYAAYAAAAAAAADARQAWYIWAADQLVELLRGAEVPS